MSAGNSLAQPKELAMYLHEQLMKARHDDLLRDAAQHRLAAQARQAQPRWRRRPAAGQARRLAGLRSRKLFT
jgi:hypothetical protein